MTVALSWVVGRGGMLGAPVEAELTRTGYPVWVPSARIPWSSEDAAVQVLADQRQAFLTAAEDGPWQLLWCAGAGVTETRAGDLDREVTTFERFLDGLEVPAGGQGSLFLASSAGGAYGGSLGAPFDEHSQPHPLGDYGRAKMAMEKLATGWARRTAGRALIGRIGNLYGPGQDIGKPQGLVTQLLRSHLQRAPLHVYVPLDTIRDLTYVQDAARKIARCVPRLLEGPPGEVIVKVVASQRGTTVGAVIGEMGRVLRRRPLIVLGSSASARFQSTDLRLRSVVWPDLDRVALTPFPAGIHAALEDVARQLQLGLLSTAPRPSRRPG